jgi:pimeloyl-ACP methyl ester carboxylesterase
MSDKYSEQAILLGGNRSLVGILARPLLRPKRDLPAIVILNTGIVHRVGHHRMYVAQSRKLAGAGYTVLRFDFSGIGDSEQRNDRLSPLKASLAEIKEALDFVADNHHGGRFVLIGLCSGADHAILYAPTDSRIDGLVLMDPSIPPTARYYFHYISQRLTKLRNWASVATGKSGLLRLVLGQLLNALSPRRGGELSLESIRFSPQLAQSYEHVAAHGVRLLAVFTAISPRQTYRSQMLDAFPRAPFADNLQQEFFPNSDHVFSDPIDRARLDELILRWAAKLPAGLAASAPHEVHSIPKESAA